MARALSDSVSSASVVDTAGSSSSCLTAVWASLQQMVSLSLGCSVSSGALKAQVGYTFPAVTHACTDVLSLMPSSIAVVRVKQADDKQNV